MILTAQTRGAADEEEQGKREGLWDFPGIWRRHAILQIPALLFSNFEEVAVESILRMDTCRLIPRWNRKDCQNRFDFQKSDIEHTWSPFASR